MTVDLSKVKPGDKVRLEVDVTERNGVLRFSFSPEDERALDPNHPWWRNTAQYSIVGHIPAPPPPWVPAVGDIFKVKGSLDGTGRWKIICMDPDGDWVTQHMGSKYKSIVRQTSQYQFELDNS